MSWCTSKSGSIRFAVVLMAAALHAPAALAQDAAAKGAPPAPAPAAPAKAGAEAAGDKAKGTGKASSNLGGYSWGMRRKAAGKGGWRHPKVDSRIAMVTFPAFRMLPDGSASVSLVVSREIEVTPASGRGWVGFFLKGAQAYTRVNTFPLVTAHFNTPLHKVRLARVKKGLELQLSLREAVKVTARSSKLPRGGMLIEAVIPATKDAYVTQSARAPLAVKRLAPAHGSVDLKPAPDYDPSSQPPPRQGKRRRDRAPAGKAGAATEPKKSGGPEKPAATSRAVPAKSTPAKKP